MNGGGGKKNWTNSARHPRKVSNRIKLAEDIGFPLFARFTYPGCFSSYWVTLGIKKKKKEKEKERKIVEDESSKNVMRLSLEYRVSFEQQSPAIEIQKILQI